MQIDTMTHKNRKERQIRLTADLTSRPRKFLLIKRQHTIGTLPFPLHTSQRFGKGAESVSQNIINQININLKF